MDSRKVLVGDLYAQVYTWERQPCMYTYEEELILNQVLVENRRKRKWFLKRRAYTTLNRRREKLLDQYADDNKILLHWGTPLAEAEFVVLYVEGRRKLKVVESKWERLQDYNSSTDSVHKQNYFKGVYSDRHGQNERNNREDEDAAERKQPIPYADCFEPLDSADLSDWLESSASMVCYREKMWKSVSVINLYETGDFQLWFDSVKLTRNKAEGNDSYLGGRMLPFTSTPVPRFYLERRPIRPVKDIVPCDNVTLEVAETPKKRSSVVHNLFRPKQLHEHAGKETEYNKEGDIGKETAPSNANRGSCCVT